MTVLESFRCAHDRRLINDFQSADISQGSRACALGDVGVAVWQNRGIDISAKERLSLRAGVADDTHVEFVLVGIQAEGIERHHGR